MLINAAGDDEWRSPDGMTLKLEGFSTVMNAKAAVDSDPQCRNRVSCADILALAARDSVFLVSTRTPTKHACCSALLLDRFRSRVDRTVSRLGVNTYVRPPQSGGPDYKVELGRFDGRVSTCGSVVIPHGTFDLDQLNGFFSSLGLNQTDMIALSGTYPRARVHAYINVSATSAS